MQMMCPKCNGQMRQYERNGVTVDQCGECRGIFLDRGELERLVDAENAWHDAQASPRLQHQPQHQPQYQQSAPQRPHRDYDSDEYPIYEGQPGHHGKRKKRGGFLEDLFD
jgi:Zn-finger nucleic acid-binding protein